MRLELCISLALLLGCANEVMTIRPPEGIGGGDSGGTGGSAGTAGSGGSSAGTPGVVAKGGSGGTITAGAAGSGGDPVGGSAGSAGSGGSAGADTAGSGGTGGSAGGGTGGSGGSGGTPGNPTVLSIGKTAQTDSEETANTVDMGNDGQTGTRWCAANDGLGHWWSVDLGQSYTLTEIEIMWEKTGPYKYLIEGSANGTAWSTLADETASTDTAQNQTLPLAGGPSARHVRISVIGLPEGSWASFFEFSVSGY